ncbi:hypothetical protein AYO21_11468 [Fonsecaea monophora]|uniref:Uncharacterized protein n=1 Tax=Fonsecaea monophora TaxID=254056 RepID=A0A177ETJ1_9EURO|nr:hypothetical protein AYO21_11468 [Fonsecaea monophora]OAG34382.1 hypothetical protein AYO21_11468 [Fonsecaea monophora]
MKSASHKLGLVGKWFGFVDVKEEGEEEEEDDGILGDELDEPTANEGDNPEAQQAVEDMVGPHLILPLLSHLRNFYFVGSPRDIGADSQAKLIVKLASRSASIPSRGLLEGMRLSCSTEGHSAYSNANGLSPEDTLVPPESVYLSWWRESVSTQPGQHAPRHSED